MAVKKWIVRGGDKEIAAHFSQEYGLDPFTSLLAVSRGICTDAQLHAFFHDAESTLSDPFIYKDMDKAVARINDAIDRGERIAVFGDYDADGVTATALLSSYLTLRAADFFYMLPDRAEGYGLSTTVITRLHAQGAKLIITVDNGINSVSETDYAKSLGIDMVITDHHHAGDVLPDAVAVVNPHRPDCPSTFKELAGVGVAFKLVCAMEGAEAYDSLLEEFADLVAIGTVADIVPLVGENRILVRRGVQNMIRDPRPGILAMRIAAGNSEKPFHAATVAFTLSPRLNAAGRMGSATRALDLLLSEDIGSAAVLADALEGANAERQRIEQDILAKAEAQLESDPERLRARVLVCDGEQWHPGVIGIVASRLVEKYGKPCIIISRSGAYAKGSGRSLEGFSLYDALKACERTLDQFGGHTLAAGLSLRSEKIDAFRRAINVYALRAEMPFPIQYIDLRLNPKYIRPDILDTLELFEPFGAGNPKPVFGLFRMRLDSITPLSGGKHLRLGLSKKDIKLNALYFGMTPEAFPYFPGSTVDLAVCLESNTYMGETQVSVLVRAIRYSALTQDSYFDGLRRYDDIRRNERFPCAAFAVPDRDFIAAVYTTLRAMGGRCRNIELLALQMQRYDDAICPILLSVDILCEMRLASVTENGTIVLLAPKVKVNLEESEILCAARRCVY